VADCWMLLRNERMSLATINDAAQRVEFLLCKLARLNFAHGFKIRADSQCLSLRKQKPLGPMSLRVVTKATRMMFDWLTSDGEFETVTGEAPYEPTRHRRLGNTLNDLRSFARVVKAFAGLRVDKMGRGWSPRRFANVLVHRETKPRVASGRKSRNGSV